MKVWERKKKEKRRRWRNWLLLGEFPFSFPLYDDEGRHGERERERYMAEERSLELLGGSEGSIMPTSAFSVSF